MKKNRSFHRQSVNLCSKKHQMLKCDLFTLARLTRFILYSFFSSFYYRERNGEQDENHQDKHPAG